MTTNILPLADLRDRMSRGLQPILVDVRTPGEFSRMHAVGARSVPLDKLNAVGVAAECCSADGRIYLICQSGTRAMMASQKFTAAGISEVFVVGGGMKTWEAAGLPVVSSASGVISLERQVRIGAGLLVLLGCLLAWLVAPQFIALSAFVGAGLIFAGITDICGMGILLGKLPWNSRADNASCQSYPN